MDSCTAIGRPSFLDAKGTRILAVGVSSQNQNLVLLKLRWHCLPVFGQRFLQSPALHFKQGHGHRKRSTVSYPSFSPASRNEQPCCQPEAVSTLQAEPCQSDPEALRVSELWDIIGVEPQPPLLEIHTSSSGVRGLAVRNGASVKAGQLILSAPMSNVLSVPKEVKGGEIDRKGPAQAKGASGDAACRLAVKLLVELQLPSSVWRQYAQFLPTDYENVAEWTPQELAELQSEAVVEAAMAAIAQWLQQAILIQTDANRQLGIMHSSPPSPKDSLGPSSGAPAANTSASALSSYERHPTVECASEIPSSSERTGDPIPAVDAPLSAAIESSSPSAPLWQPPISKAAAFWALRTVLTRAFSATFNEVPVQCLVPICDLLNHAPPGKPFQANPSPVWPRSHSATDLGFGQWRIHSPQGQSPSDACFQVFASTPLAAGQEATISYGPHSNLEFLVSYGFVPETNPADSVTLYHSIQAILDDVDAPVKLERQKAELLCGLMGRTRHFSADADGTAPSLLESLYVLHARDAAELSGLESTWQRTKSLNSARISRATRAAAGRQVVQRCTELLAQYSTSLEEDMKRKEELDADSAGVNRRLRMALGLRIARKEILTRTRRRYAALAEMT